VRELRNVVERVVIMQLEDEVRAVELPGGDGGTTDPETDAVFAAATLSEFQERAERLFLARALQRQQWNVAATARAINTPRSNLYKKIEAYGLRREE
jgi:two-component system nitrogen regulation response regulator NtrX